MTPVPQKLIDWLQESLNRVFEKQPKYFKYWTYFSYVLMGISGVPYILDLFPIDLPEPFATLKNKFVTGLAVAMFVMSKLTIKTPPVGKTDEGKPVMVHDEQKLPFTSKSESKDVQEAVPPPPVLSEVPEQPPPEEKK